MMDGFGFFPGIKSYKSWLRFPGIKSYKSWIRVEDSCVSVGKMQVRMSHIHSHKNWTETVERERPNWTSVVTFGGVTLTYGLSISISEELRCQKLSK